MKFFKFLWLQVVLWHSDYHTNYYRLRLMYDPDSCVDEIPDDL